MRECVHPPFFVAMKQTRCGNPWFWFWFGSRSSFGFIDYLNSIAHTRRQSRHTIGTHRIKRRTPPLFQGWQLSLGGYPYPCRHEASKAWNPFVCGCLDLFDTKNVQEKIQNPCVPRVGVVRFDQNECARYHREAKHVKQVY